MNSIYIGAVVSCIICSYANAVWGYPQFYYMVPAPPQQTPASTYYSTPFGSNPSPYSFGAPATSFVSRSFGPSQAYYTTHQTFGSLAGPAPPIGYHNFAEHSSNGLVQTPTTQQHPGSVFAQIPTTTVFSTQPSEQYRGFAYHTQSTNGASANVFFLTGPEAHQIGNLQTFMSKISQNFTGNQSVDKAKKLASDTVDSNATDKNQQQQIGESLNGTPQGPAFDALRSFFENPQIGFQQFYSSNGQLFSKSFENQNLKFPANTILLPSPISIQAFGNFGLNPRFGQIENKTETNTTSEKSEDKGEEGAESMIADVKVIPTDSDTIQANTTSNEINIDSRTETVSSSVSTNTESVKEDATTKDNPRTVKEVRSIKQESSTEKNVPITSVKAESSSKISESTTVETITKGISSTTKAA